MPDYERFIPKTEFIKDDNRFSPQGVEWLYLAFAPKKPSRGLTNAEKCALNECRAIKGEEFALCKFKPHSEYYTKTLIDLTISKNVTFEKLNSMFENCIQQIINREVLKIYISKIINDEVSEFSIDELPIIIEKWLIFTYAKLLTEQIFLPVTEEDKSIMYAPFQCMAQYFLNNGYIGIVYSSTVYPEGKNIVLFNKHAAFPYDKIKHFKITKEIH